MTDVVNEICELKLKDVGDGFGHFGRKDSLCFYIGVEHQHSKDVTNC